MIIITHQEYRDPWEPLISTAFQVNACHIESPDQNNDVLLGFDAAWTHKYIPNFRGQMETRCFSETSVSSYESMRRQNPQVYHHPNRLIYHNFTPSTSLPSREVGRWTTVFFSKTHINRDIDISKPHHKTECRKKQHDPNSIKMEEGLPPNTSKFRSIPRISTEKFSRGIK